MKLFITILSFLLIGGAIAADDVCYANAQDACGSGSKAPTRTDIDDCNSKYGGFSNIVVERKLQDYVNRQLASSFDYLVLTSFFNSYQKDRPGFVKLFRSLSDRSFDDAIKLIKQITKRGGAANFKYHEEDQNTISGTTLWELDELFAIGKVLDNEKKLSQRAIHIHSHISKPHSSINEYDPEITQFLEEEFLGKQSATIRKLSGYANDLWKMIADPAKQTSALAVYLFDQYLQKQ